MTRASASLATARAAVLDAAEAAVIAFGWSTKALDAAVAQAGIDAPLARRAFPRGPRSLLDEFHRAGDARMAAAMALLDLAALRTGQRIALAVRRRIEAIGDKRLARRAVAFQVLPENAPSAARSLARSVDAIWRAAGDRSLDFSYYTKRATLAAVYAATVLYWLQDSSDDGAPTWAFLNRRLRGVAAFGAARKRASAAVEGIASGALGFAKRAAGVLRQGPGVFPTRWTGWRGTR